MRIQASAGRLPKKISINEQCYKLTLTGDNESERMFLAELTQVMVNGRMKPEAERKMLLDIKLHRLAVARII